MSTSETPSTQEEASNEVPIRVRGKTDIAWAHCKIIQEGTRTALLCIHCNKKIRGGGINRFKCHLAQISGQVGICLKVPDVIRDQMKQNIEEGKNKKRKSQAEYEEDSSSSSRQTPVQEVEQTKKLVASQKGRRIDTFIVPRTGPGSQPTLQSVLQSKEIVEKCDLAVSKWFIDSCVPFNAANSAYFQPMCDALCSMGPGYKMPTMHRLRGPLLNRWVDDTKKLVEEYRAIWKETGCTLMADGWTDRCKRSLINFLVYCPKGTVFLKSVDASHASKTALLLFNLFKEVVLHVGPENVVHIVTDNAANYVAAGKLLEAEFPKLYWSPCAAHCINLMLSDMGGLPEVNEAVSHASQITKYIYNHCYALFLMRKNTGGKEILRPAQTRFATNFIALQSILAQKNPLRAMVTSQEWTTSAYAKDAKGKKFVDLVLESQFWTKCADIVKVTEPLVRVLRMVDSEDRPAMGFLYHAMYKAKEEMVRRFRRNKKQVEPYLKIVDKRWDSQLHKNLHAAAYWLNPACRFNREEFEKHKSTTSGLHDVIERYCNGDRALRAKLTSEMRKYKDAEGDFGRHIAVQERTTVMPDEWWEFYGCDVPSLQKMAIRILSQTCSASGCERNWSVFEHIHSKKRNRLEHQKLNDLVFVRYNLRLQNRKKRARDYDPINFESQEDLANWVMEDSPPFLTSEEVEALRKDLANMTIQPISSDIDELNLEEEGGDDVAEDANLEANLDDNNIDDEDMEAPPLNDLDYFEGGPTTFTSWD